MGDTTIPCDYGGLVTSTCPECGHFFTCNDQNTILGNERYEVVYRPIVSKGQLSVPDDSDALPAVFGNVLEDEEEPSSSKHDSYVPEESPGESFDFGASLEVVKYNEYVWPTDEEGTRPVAGTRSVAEESEKKESAQTDRKRKENPEETKPAKKMLRGSFVASSSSEENPWAEIGSGDQAAGSVARCPVPPSHPVANGRTEGVQANHRQKQMPGHSVTPDDTPTAGGDGRSISMAREGCILQGVLHDTDNEEGRVGKQMQEVWWDADDEEGRVGKQIQGVCRDADDEEGQVDNKGLTVLPSWPVPPQPRDVPDWLKPLCGDDAGVAQASQSVPEKGGYCPQCFSGKVAGSSALLCDIFCPDCGHRLRFRRHLTRPPLGYWNGMSHRTPDVPSSPPYMSSSSESLSSTSPSRSPVRLVPRPVLNLKEAQRGPLALREARLKRRRLRSSSALSFGHKQRHRR